MRTHFLAGGLVWAGLVVATHIVQAQQPPSVWTVKTYPYPGDLLSGGFVTETKGRLQPPPSLPQNPSEEDIRNHIRRCTAVLREYLKTQAVELPEGSLLALDKERHQLAARTTAAGHDDLASLMKWIQNRLPKVIAMQVQVMEAEAVTMRQVMAEAAGKADDTALLERLEGLVAGGQVSVAGLAKLESKSGQRALVKTGAENQFASEFKARADGSSAGAAIEFENEGLQFEVDPIVDHEGRIVDLTVAIELPTAPTRERLVPIGSIGGQRAQARVTDRQTGKINTSTTLVSGQTRLLAVWPAEEAARSQAAFITAHALPVRLRQDNRALQWLTQHGEAVQPVPATPDRSDEDLGIPAGMILKRFHIPPDFLSAASSPAAPADAFGGGAALRSPEPTLMVRMTAQEILKSEGIPFPEGASATFRPERSELIVRNTPENMALVDAFLAERHHWIPRTLHFQLRLVEADGALVRRLSREALAMTDHESAWQSLTAEVEAGRADYLASAMMESKSGQRSVVESIMNYTMVNAELGDQVSTITKSDDKNAVNVAAARPVAEIGASIDIRRVGLSWEIDSILGADGYTMDVVQSIQWHARLPREHFVQPAEAEGIIKVDTPTVDLFPQTLNSSLTTYPGMKRWVGTWQKLDANGQLDPGRLIVVFIEAAVCAVE